MKIEMTKCDHCGKITEEAPLLIGLRITEAGCIRTMTIGSIGNRADYDDVKEACGPACRLKIIDKLLDGEKTEHVA